MPKIKRLLCLMLAAALLLCAAWSVACADDAAGYTFALNAAGDGYVVTGYTGGESSLTVPDWYEGKPVTEIGDSAFEDNAAITRVALPSTITVIGRAAFKRCTNLSTLTTYTAADQPPQTTLAGDANGDGAVDIHDALLIMKHSAGWTVSLDDECADVNASGSVNIEDALLILQHCAGMDVTLQ